MGLALNLSYSFWFYSAGGRRGIGRSPGAARSLLTVLNAEPCACWRSSSSPAKPPFRKVCIFQGFWKLTWEVAFVIYLDLPFLCTLPGDQTYCFHMTAVYLIEWLVLIPPVFTFSNKSTMILQTQDRGPCVCCADPLHTGCIPPYHRRLLHLTEVSLCLQHSYCRGSPGTLWGSHHWVFTCDFFFPLGLP